MLYILMTVIVLVAMMAKHGRPSSRGRRWTANMKKVQLDSSLALSTLALNDVVSGDFIAAGDESFRLLNIQGLWSMRGITVGEGPVVFGVAHGDYSAAEIEECLEVATGLTRGDKVAKEQGDRLVRRIGLFDASEADQEINDGKPIHTRLNWHITEGQTIQMWAWNKSGANPMTTGAVLLFQGSLTVKWT